MDDVCSTTATATATATVTNGVSVWVRVVDPGALRLPFVAVRVTVTVGVWPPVK